MTEKEISDKKNLLAIIETIIGITAFSLTWVWISWKVALLIFLFTWVEHLYHLRNKI